MPRTEKRGKNRIEIAIDLLNRQISEMKMYLDELKKTMPGAAGRKYPNKANRNKH